MSLKAYYKLDADGTDYSGNGYNLTAQGTPTYIPGKFGKGAYFNNDSTNYLWQQSSNLGIDGGAISMGCWFKITSGPSANKYFWLIGQESNTADVMYLIYLDYTAVNGISFVRQKLAVANQGPTITGMNPAAGVWYHYMLTYDTTDVKAYINGKLVGSAAASGNGSYASAVNGCSIAVTPRKSAGDGATVVTIDEAVFYNHAWSAQDVRRYYNQSRGRFAPKVV